MPFIPKTSASRSLNSISISRSVLITRIFAVFTDIKNFIIFLIWCPIYKLRFVNAKYASVAHVQIWNDPLTVHVLTPSGAFTGFEYPVSADSFPRGKMSLSASYSAVLSNKQRLLSASACSSWRHAENSPPESELSVVQWRHHRLRGQEKENTPAFELLASVMELTELCAFRINIMVSKCLPYNTKKNSEHSKKETTI